MIKYRMQKGKYVFDKDDTYYALTKEQVGEMFDLCGEILGIRNPCKDIDLDDNMFIKGDK